jgi:Ribbon-helix-helix protein, copG family
MIKCKSTATWQDVIMPHTPDRHFRAGDDLYLPARAKAALEGRSLSWIIRLALQLYLDDQLPLPEPGGQREPATALPATTQGAPHLAK